MYEIYECYAFYFYLDSWFKYVVKYYFFCFLNSRGYPWISVKIKKICEYLHSRYPYGYGYEANIYPTGKVRGSYYAYLTCLVDIPRYKKSKNQVTIQNY